MRRVYCSTSFGQRVQGLRCSSQGIFLGVSQGGGTY